MNDKVALITGASSGIGKATAILLASKGAKVIIAARREEAGQRVVEEIQQQGGEAAFIKMDVGNEDSVRNGIQWIVDTYGKLDLAVNNAGISQALTPFVESETKLLQDIFQTNVYGTFFSMKYEILEMLKTGGGAIVNVSSINGIKSMAGAAPYGASKYAVEALTKSAALEVAEKNIRINSIAPAMTKTEILASLGEAAEETSRQLGQMVPLKRMAEAEEIAKGIVYLLSDDASFVTGSTLVVDGGFTV